MADSWVERFSTCVRSAAAVTCITLTACGHSQPPESGGSAMPPAIRYQSNVSPGGYVPPAGDLRNPHVGDPATAQVGRALFTSMNCDGCHAPDADGLVGPNLADGRWRYGGTDAEIFTSIYYGRVQGMPGYGGAIGTEGIWALVTYLQSLPVPADVATESWVDK